MKKIINLLFLASLMLIINLPAVNASSPASIGLKGKTNLARGEETTYSIVVSSGDYIGGEYGYYSIFRNEQVADYFEFISFESRWGYEYNNEEDILDLSDGAEVWVGLNLATITFRVKEDAPLGNHLMLDNYVTIFDSYEKNTVIIDEPTGQNNKKDNDVNTYLIYAWLVVLSIIFIIVIIVLVSIMKKVKKITL